MSEIGALTINNRLVLRTSGLVMAGLALAGCGAAETNNLSPTQPTSSASGVEVSPAAETPSAPSPSLTSEEDTTCLEPTFAVSPGSRLDYNNTADLQNQLDALGNAKSPDLPITLDVVKNAGAILYNSLNDNAYALALARAAEGPADEIPSAADIVNGKYDVTANCMTKEQLKHFNILFTTLVEGLEPKVTQKVSTHIQGTYAYLIRNYDAFQKNYKQELAN